MKTDNYRLKDNGELYCTKDMNITLEDNSTVLAPLWKQYCAVEDVRDVNGTVIGSEPKCQDFFRESNVTKIQAIPGLNMKTFKGRN